MIYGNFHEDVLPDSIALGARTGPEFNTQVATMESGEEERNQRWSRPKWRAEIGFSDRIHEDVRFIQKFFIARAGRAHPFRMRMIDDYTTRPAPKIVCGETRKTEPDPDEFYEPTPFDDCLITIAEMTSNNVDLSRTYQSGGRVFRRRIYKPRVRGFRVGMSLEDGSQVELTDGWSLDASRGIVCFDFVPTGVCLFWGGYYDTPVRFDNDWLPATMSLGSAGEYGSYQSVPIIEVTSKDDVMPETEDDEIRAALGVSEDIYREIVEAQEELALVFDNSSFAP